MSLFNIPTNNPGGKTVLVEQVIDRPFKDDCRAHTGISWHGKGDRQRYPAALWNHLAGHPDVWKLIPEDADGNPIEEKPPTVNDLLSERSQELAGTGTLVAHVELDPSAGTAAMADAYDYTSLTKDAQADMTADAMRALAVTLDYGLHPRLTEDNMRKRFAEITLARMESHVDDKAGE